MSGRETSCKGLKPAVLFMQQLAETLGLRFHISTQGLKMCFCCGQKRSAFPEVKRKADGLGLVSSEAYMWSVEKLSLIVVCGF